MKKLRLFIFLAVLCVAAAAFYFIMLPSLTASTLQTQSDSLCLPQAKWDSSIDDTLAAFGATREELGDDFYPSGYYGGGYAIVKGKTVFGVESTELLLNFQQTEDKAGSLIYVAIHYPEDADMETVLSEMKKAYGEPAEDGSFQRYGELDSIKVTSDPSNRYWLGVEASQFLTPEEKEALGYYFGDIYLTTAQWSTDYHLGPSASGESQLSDTPNVVVLDARHAADVDSALNPITIGSQPSE